MKRARLVIWLVFGLSLSCCAVLQGDVDAWHADRLARLKRTVRPYEHPGESLRNVVYKQVDDWYGLLDLYMPPDVDGEVPLVLYFHGGGWAGGSKEDIHPARWKDIDRLTELTRRGIAVASVDYRLCKFDLEKTTIRDCVTDCKDAVRFMVKHAVEYDIDPERIAVWGGSAGGHLAQMTVLTPPESFPGDPLLLAFSTSPVGGVSYFGPSDFEHYESFGLSSEKAYHNRWRNRLFLEGTEPDRIGELEAEISPVRYLRKDSPPMLFIHGNMDRTISYKQMELMQRRAQELNAPIQFMTVQNAGHGWKQERPDVEIFPSESEITVSAIEFLERVLGDEHNRADDLKAERVSRSASGAPPNFVFVLLDDVGAGWIAPYAERLKPADLEPEIIRSYAQWQKRKFDLDRHIDAARTAMPTLSRLAREGVVFDRAFAKSSLCAPSRAGLLTGTFQQRWRVYDNTDIEAVTGLMPDYPCLAENLQNAGYTCGVIGKWHVGRKDPDVLRAALAQGGFPVKFSENKTQKQIVWPVRKEARKLGYYDSCCAEDHPLNNGFDFYFGYNSPSALFYECESLWDHNGLVPKRPAGEFLTELFSEKALGFVEDAVADTQPFFLYLSYMSNHGPLDSPPEKYGVHFNTGVPLTDHFAGHLRAVDEGLTQLVDLLQKKGELDNTLFVLASDNGQPTAVPPYNAPFKGGKGTGWIGGLRVPLILFGAGVERNGFESGLVSMADVLPTFLDMAGVVLPDQIDGKSLKSFLAGRETTVPRTWLASTGLHSTRWSYSYYGGERNKKDSATCPLYGVVIEGDQVLMTLTETPAGLYREYPDGIPASNRLYNLKEDPMQQVDAAARYPEKDRVLSRRLNDWLKTLQPPAQNHEGQLEELKELNR